MVNNVHFVTEVHVINVHFSYEGRATTSKDIQQTVVTSD